MSIKPKICEFIRVISINILVILLLLFSLDRLIYYFRFYILHSITYLEFDKEVTKVDREKFSIDPNLQFETKNRTSNEIIYSVKYSIDEFGRRLTKNAPDRNASILTFGCSNTFGMGLNDDQTLASALQQSQLKYNVYNYGVPGTTISYAVNQVPQIDISEFKTQDIVVFYFFYNFHYPRLIPSLMTDKGKRTLAYSNEAGQLIYDPRETFFDNIFLYIKRNLFQESQILKIIEFDWPKPSYTTAKLAANLFQSFDITIKKRLPNAKFFVVLKHTTQSSKLKSVVVRDLKKLGIGFVDLDNKFDPKLYNIHPLDNHPNSNGNSVLAKIIIKELSKMGLLTVSL